MGLGPHLEHSHGKETVHSNVHMGCMPPTMDEEQLINMFSYFGRVVEAKVIRDYVNGSRKVYDFVKFDDIHCVFQATARMNGYRLEGIKIWSEEPIIGNDETRNMVVNASTGASDDNLYQLKEFNVQV